MDNLIVAIIAFASVSALIGGGAFLYMLTDKIPVFDKLICSWIESMRIYQEDDYDERGE